MEGVCTYRKNPNSNAAIFYRPLVNYSDFFDPTKIYQIAQAVGKG